MATIKIKTTNSFLFRILEKPHQGVFVQLPHLLHASILNMKVCHWDNFENIHHTCFRSQVMLIFVIFKAASKMSSALKISPIEIISTMFSFSS